MIIDNPNRIEAVDQFVSKYKDLIVEIYPILMDKSILIEDIEKDNNLQSQCEFADVDYDSPYSIKLDKGRIVRVKSLCKNLSVEEEIALIIHEIGHCIVYHYKIVLSKQHGGCLEEVFCDNISHALGLSRDIVSALDKLAMLPNVNKDIIEKRRKVAESMRDLVETQDLIMQNDTLSSYFQKTSCNPNL